MADSNPGITRRSFLHAGAASAVTLYSGTHQQVFGKAKADSIRENPPNMVLMLADDSGWTDYGFMGNPFVITPNIDDMAKKGLHFNQFYASSPVCSPTRMSYLTGRYPTRGNVMTAGDTMPADEVTFAEILRGNGYTTGHFGKWHIGGMAADSPTGPMMQGFEHSFSASNSYMADKFRTERFKLNGENVGVTLPDDGFDGVTLADGDPGDPAYDECYVTKVIMDEAIEWIEQQAQEGKRFCAVIQFFAPHDPFMSSPKYLNMYGNDDDFCKRGDKHPGEERAFWAMISGIDDQIGRLRSKLKELNVYDNTLTWFTSDNGGVSYSSECYNTGKVFGGTKLSGGKGNTTEGGFRVPSVIEWPGVTDADTVTDYVAGTDDMLPTVCDIIGYDISNLNRPIDGRSILSVLRNEPDERPEPMMFHFDKGKNYKSDYPMYVIRDNQHRLTVNKDFEIIGLYDLTVDPKEENNIASGNEDITGPLYTKLQEWWESVENSRTGADYGEVSLAKPKKSGWFSRPTNGLSYFADGDRIQVEYTTTQKGVLWAELSDMRGRVVTRKSFAPGRSVTLHLEKRAKSNLVLSIRTAKRHLLVQERLALFSTSRR